MLTWENYAFLCFHCSGTADTKQPLKCEDMSKPCGGLWSRPLGLVSDVELLCAVLLPSWFSSCTGTAAEPTGYLERTQ